MGRNIRELLISRTWASSLMAQMVMNPPARKETQGRSLGQEDLLEKGLATHSSILSGEFHGQKSLVVYSSWDHRESDMTAQLTHTHECGITEIFEVTFPIESLSSEL